MKSSFFRRLSGAFAICLSLSLMMGSCKKGDTGPAGPKGDSAIANVFYSDWKMATGFNDSTVDNSSIKVGYIAAPQIDAGILKSGAVLVYFTYGGGTFALPYTSNAGGKPNTISYTPMTGKILAYRFTHDNSNSVALSSQLQYRYIIIPGGVPANNAAGVKTGQATDGAAPSVEELKSMSYEQVCRTLSIQP